MNFLQPADISRRRLLLQHIALALLLFTMLPATYSQTKPSQSPLSKDDVVKLLTGAVSPRRISELAQERGIAFQITPEVESQLRSAGADEGLLSTLKQLAPKAISSAPVPPPSATLVINSSVGGARVYVDDVVIGDTSSQGRLKVPNLTPGQHDVRVTLDGYEKFEGTVELSAGEIVDLRVTLKMNSPPQPAVGASGHSDSEASTNSGRFRVDRIFFGSGGHHGWLRITDKVQYQSDDGKEDIEFPANDIEDAKKHAGSVWIVRLRTGKKYEFRSADKNATGAVLDAIHAAMAHSQAK